MSSIEILPVVIVPMIVFNNIFLAVQKPHCFCKLKVASKTFL